MSHSSGLESGAERVKFGWEQLSPEPPTEGDVQLVRRVCLELDDFDLVTPYPSSSLVGSNGNVSYRRTPEGGFVVTATQLASKRDLRAQDFIIVERYELPQKGAVQGKAFYHGSKLPSSESILHWYFYRKFPEIGAVIHVHERTGLLYHPASRALWKELGVVETSRIGEAGTIDLPKSADEVLDSIDQYVILKGHHGPRDEAHTGVVVLGKDLNSAIERTLAVHERLASVAEAT